jgi:putative transposase
LSERQQFVDWLTEAVAAGARKAVACAELGVSLRTLQRWTEADVMRANARTTTARAMPANALSQDEREAILAACNHPDHANLPPSQIVPRLADQGCYLGSEATFYRVMHAAEQQNHRGGSQAPNKPAAPTTHVATGPN